MAAAGLISVALQYIEADESMEGIVLHIIKTYKEC
jgi:hypothetical protein